MHSFATEVDRKTAADPAAVMAKLEAMNLPEMPKDISRLFTKFTRTEDARKVDPNGTGIGLYYAHHVTQAHHGK
ncbi:MAG: hypothetical protein U1A23_03925, partial [Candidatus Sungbacteria bacterium]|nr:hypothetical protein [Candidatus Sungbacteria bacterium]